MIGAITAQTGIVRGTIRQNGSIAGSMRVPIGVVPIDNYEGPYDIIPKVEEQIMDTAGKRMTDDVSIQAIPLYEVSNTCGLTLIIGG